MLTLPVLQYSSRSWRYLVVDVKVFLASPPCTCNSSLRAVQTCLIEHGLRQLKLHPLPTSPSVSASSLPPPLSSHSPLSHCHSFSRSSSPPSTHLPHPSSCSSPPTSDLLPPFSCLPLPYSSHSLPPSSPPQQSKPELFSRTFQPI